jgi:ribosome-associated protein
MRPDYSPSSIKTSGSLSTDQDLSRQLAFTIAQAAEDRKGGEIVLLCIAEISYLADYFVIMTGFSKTQVRAISQSITEKVEELWHRHPLRKEGQAEGSWVLLDYGEVIVHILMPQEREYYDLEAFWAHAEKVDFTSSE